MLMIDANLLIFAYHSQSTEHASAKAWVEEAFSGTEPIGLPWQTILAFLRIVTHRGVFERPLLMKPARSIVAGWLERPQIQTVEAGPQFFETFARLLDSGQVRGALVTDAALAALAIENGATLCSADRDFARFPGLKWTNPLLA